jgi:hypothetical protein
MKFMLLFAILVGMSGSVLAHTIESKLTIKTAGNPALEYPLTWLEKKSTSWSLKSDMESEVEINVQRINNTYTFKISALENVNLNLQNYLLTNFKYEKSDFLLPGLWYKKNRRSSPGSPSINEASSWSFREDRLSTPLTGVYHQTSHEALTITRVDAIDKESLGVPYVGDVMLTGYSDLGSLGFGKSSDNVYLQFGYPYQESPKTYIRKLTLAPESLAFVSLQKGDVVELSYEVIEQSAENYADFVKQVWQYSFDTMQPQVVKNVLPTEDVKSILSNFYKESFINDAELSGFSGAHITTANAERLNVLEVGFIGRVLLNAFNSLEYGEQIADKTLISMGQEVFDTYLEHGFNQTGFIRENVDFVHPGNHLEDVLSIRRQSEGIYAALLYMQKLKTAGKASTAWEKKIAFLLDNLLKLQRKEGSFPRKFDPQFNIIDDSGGSSASAVLALVMAYTYFDDSKYLISAKQTAEYLAKEIVLKSEYFSSTLDANSVDKEASFYTATAFYYLALVSNGEERQNYLNLATTANYFVMSWYYTWDVPFAKGQMLGDVGFKTRGWGNVSVENNHVDVFIFGYLDVMRWLAKETHDSRLNKFADVIESSMKSQLLPREGHMFNIGKVGYHPEVVQHTNWDYGHFGKGFYNDIFAPGWVVASLWEMLTPGRAEDFLIDKPRQ